MAKKDNKSHHDRGAKYHYNLDENENQFVQKSDPRLNQQQITYQNLAQNEEEGNVKYRQIQQELDKSENKDQF